MVGGVDVPRMRVVVAAAAVAAVLVPVIASGGTSAHEHRHALRRDASRPAVVPPGTALLTVGTATGSPPVHPGFLGLSLEFPAIQAYATSDPQLFEQLVRNLAPGQSPILKIGGDSTDWAWWPVPGMARPPGVRYTLGRRWLGATRRVARALGARLILGIDLEADSARLAATEARAFLAGIGRQWIDALELGNEPELYPSWGWYRAADGVEIPGRPHSYGFNAYTENYGSVASFLPRLPLAGPAIGAPGWMRHVGQFVTSEPRLSLVTLHRYPLQRCFFPAASPLYPTIHNLLASEASAGLASSVARYASLAHAHGLGLRVDELNSVSCGGAPGVSNTFASALWVLDAAFQMARVGVDGVNIHTFPGATYGLFDFRRLRGIWGALVHPEYYGLMMFAQAAPPRSELMRVSGRFPEGVRAWATRATDARIRVVLINDSSVARAVAVRIPAAGATATLERLTAPGIRATRGVMLGGQTFGARTTTGVLAGAPRRTSVAPARGEYPVILPAASAALLTLQRS